MSNLKILIIPSWYPTPNQPLRGSFFKEQAKFLQGKNGLDIHVLYGEKRSFSFLLWSWLFIKSWLKPIWPISKKNVQQDPNAFGFDLPTNRRIPDKFQIILEQRLYLKAYQSLIRLNWVPDLIHAQSGMDAGIYAQVVSNTYDVPFVILEHQVFVFHYYSKLRSKLVVQAFEAARKTAAVSEDERRQVLMNQPNCNPEIIWNFVDETKYHIQLENRSKVFTIITILNSLPIKGFDTFLEAISEIVKVTQDFKFIMIGKGADEYSNDPASNIFVKKSKELGIYDFGEFYPFISRDQIGKILNTAHVFVSPTIQEPHGIAIREAMMCGLPIVSTANGGAEDSVNKKVGLIVPIKNPIALSEGILNIKKGYSNYDAEEIREAAILQCGQFTFINSMMKFYQLQN